MNKGIVEPMVHIYIDRYHNEHLKGVNFIFKNWNTIEKKNAYTNVAKKLAQ